MSGKSGNGGLGFWGIVGAIILAVVILCFV